ncbi:transcriptional regulator [Elizabethkingia sp. JS20170427COW]|uniref:transcriptional regulator n=1 Tax=Elizabethkingia sp. JS20170427COW TaxID=2583851 RepID=UPI0011102793|nr:transcriptional regulator [Elizabethkingia sp. JS20170427COW]QCX52485.1 transcriptional regulator [Elizabethkingia sp. JS20170427COW]
MNYIRHLTGFYDKIQQDERLNPTHISLYLALFQFWNINHFQNPISISRNEMMRLSKISALGTYHKCIKELQTFGYIEYIPSFNPYKGSLVNLYNFENSEVQDLNRKHTKKRTTIEQEMNTPRIKIDTGSRQVLIPSINNTNIINNKHNVTPPKSHSLFEEEKKENNSIVTLSGVEASLSTKNHQPTPSYHGEPVEASRFSKPQLSEIQMYFAEKDARAEEAEKFFNHYESNGWLVGGKSKMKNWQAAARNWLLNAKKFNSNQNLPSTNNHQLTTKNNHLRASTNKSYQEKL